MTLAEKQATYDFATLDFAKGEHKQAANMARHPFGQMPSLEDGSFTLFESRAMMRYIDETASGPALTPREPKQRALMEQWISVETDDYNPGVAGIVFQEVFMAMRGGTADATKVAESIEKLKACLPVLDKHLAKGPYFLGDQFTLADITYMPYTAYAMNTSAKPLILSHKNFSAWWNRVSERDSWKKISAK
jgi:glutathione S-transferase